MLFFYLSPNLSPSNFGGSVVAKSNLHALQSVPDSEVIAFSVSRNPATNVIRLPSSESKFGTLIYNLMLLSSTTLNLRGFILFFQYIKRHKPDAIWFDSSCFGVIIWFIHRFFPHIKTYVFYQNIEKNMIKLEVDLKWINVLKMPSVLLNEYLCINYSTHSLAITEKVANYIKIKNPDVRCTTISIGRPDDISLIKFDNPLPFEYILFVGSNFPPNIEAIKYLNQQIAPKLKELKIVIVGAGTERYRAVFDNVHIIGGVESLSAFYQSATVVVAPIVSGDGIKIKIAEALMHGKSVVATPFAAIGYESAPIDSLYIANSDDDFIHLINQPHLKFNQSARQYWMQNFSQEALQERINLLMR